MPSFVRLTICRVQIAASAALTGMIAHERLVFPAALWFVITVLLVVQEWALIVARRDHA